MIHKPLLVLLFLCIPNTLSYSQVNFLDADDTEYNLSYYEKEFGGKIEKVIWELEGGFYDPTNCNAGAIVVFASRPQNWIALHVKLDGFVDWVEIDDLESMDDYEARDRIKEERFATWKEKFYSMSLIKSREIIDSTLKQEVIVIIDSNHIPDFYADDEGMIIGVKTKFRTRQFNESVWYDTRMTAGCQRSKGFGIRFPYKDESGMMDSIVIESIVHQQHPKCDSQKVNAIWWKNDLDMNFYASYSTHFEYLINQFISVSDYVGNGNVFFARCNDGNSLAWYMFSPEFPEGEYVDIPNDSKIEPRIVGGDSYLDGFDDYVIVLNKKVLGAYFTTSKVFFPFPKDYKLISNNEYESVIVKKGKKKYYYEVQSDDQAQPYGRFEAIIGR
jgi:hypothetical protein